MNFKPNLPDEVIKNNLDLRWKDKTVYNHYDTPLLFMEDCIANQDAGNGQGKKYIQQGIRAFENMKNKNTSYNKQFEDVAIKVRNKLIARGFTTKLLYGVAEFTNENTGVRSNQRTLLGYPDCYFKDKTLSDSKLFHDLYINLSYSAWTEDSLIEKNSYALYALVQELSKLISMRVFIINHVGSNPPTCYSYCLKKFRQDIKPEEFLFFTFHSKQTFGWATYDLIGDSSSSTVGQPEGTVSIVEFNLDKEIDNLWDKLIKTSPQFRKAIGQ